MILVSPRLALLSLAESNFTSDTSGTTYLRQKDLNNVSQILDSLGVRVVRYPSRDLSYWQPAGGVRDAM